MLRQRGSRIIPATLDAVHVSVLPPSFLLPAFATSAAAATSTRPVQPLASTSRAVLSPTTAPTLRSTRVRLIGFAETSEARPSELRFAPSSIASRTFSSAAAALQSAARVRLQQEPLDRNDVDLHGDPRAREDRIRSLLRPDKPPPTAIEPTTAPKPRYNARINPDDILVSSATFPRTPRNTEGHTRRPLSPELEPRTRGELIRAIHQAPVSAWGDDTLHPLLELRAHIKRLSRLDDTAPVSALSTLGIQAGQPIFSLRLLRNSMDAIMQRYADAPELAVKKVSRMLEQPLRRLRKDQSFVIILAITNAALARRCNTLVVLKNHLRALYELGRYPEAIKAFGMFAQHDVEPDGACWDEYVGAHLHHSTIAVAQEALAEKNACGHATTANTVLMLLDGMYRFGGNRVMEDRVLNEPEPEALSRSEALSQDVRVLNRIMSVRIARRDLEGAVQVLTRHFDLASALRARVASMYGVDPDEPFTRSIHFRPKPDLATFVILAKGLIKQQRYDIALELIGESQGTSPPLGVNDHVVAVVVLCLAERRPRGLVEARRFLKDLPPGIASFRKDASGTRVSFPPFTPSDTAFETLLAATLRQSGLGGAKALLERLIETNNDGSVSVSEGTIAVLVEYLAQQQGQVRRAAALIVRLWELSTAEEGKRRPTLQSVNALLAGASNGFRGTPSQENDATARALLPNEIWPPASKDELISEHSGQLISGSDAARIRASLKDRVLQPDRTTSELLLEAISPVNSTSRDVSPMWDHLQASVLDRGIRPTYRHLVLIIRAYIHLSDPQGARRALTRGLEHLSVEPHVALYSVLINGLTLCGDAAGAREVYQQMRDQGIEPNRSIYIALALGFVRQRDHEGARLVFDEAKRIFANEGIETDPVFIGVEYRARISGGQFLDAVRWLNGKLKLEGVEGDEVLAWIVKRSWRWFKWKSNQRKEGKIAKDGVLKDWSHAEVEDLTKLLRENRAIVRGSVAARTRKDGRGWKEAQKVWSQARVAQ